MSSKFFQRGKSIEYLRGYNTLKTVSKIFTLFVVIAVGLFASVAQSYAANIPAANCSYGNVSSAINSVAVGDTVTVPAGSCTWTSTLNITKGISLIGAGVGNTIITSSTGLLISYNPSDKNANALMRISGFTFDLGGGTRSGIDLSSGNTLVLQTKVRVDHNRFQNIAQGTSQAVFILFRGVRGVIDNNYFTSAAYAVRTHTNPVDWGQGYWNNHEGINLSQDGNNMWLEDNTFNVNTDWGAIDCVEALRYAFRYNTINANGGQPMFDLHGNVGNQRSCMGGVIYGNNLVSSGSGTFLDQRGGRFFVFNNNLTTSGWNVQIRDESDAANSPVGPYVGPNPPQYSQDVKGTYIWNNRVNFTGSLMGYSTGPNCYGSDCSMHTTDIPKPGRDFFTNTTSPGVTAGTLANRPATCTMGQGYWATTQSTTNLTGMVGPNPASPISGTFYKCTASNIWDSGISLLPYPHPLRAEASGLAAPYLHPPVVVP